MKFITEEYLRDLFRKEPFTTYELKEGQRLTPGACEFLRDKRINISDKKKQSPDINIKHAKHIIINKEKRIKVNCKKKKFNNKLKLIEAMFLDAAQELLDKDILLAQLVINLGKELVSIINITDKYSLDIPSYFKECTGIKAVNLKEDLDDCFEITEFHIQLESGRQIIILHKLRCYVKELESLFLELYENDEEEEFISIVIGKINETLNILSQRICSIVGGKTCQRRS